jgi:hypothetical protein
VWKEVVVASIEMNVGGCRKREAKRKLDINSALVAQSTSMIKEKTL